MELNNKYDLLGDNLTEKEEQLIVDIIKYNKKHGYKTEEELWKALKS